MSAVSFLSCLLLAAAVVQVHGSEYKGTFAGENACYGQFAMVNVRDAFANVEESAIVRAVAESFATATNSVSSATAEAQSVARLVLEVTARAIATVNARIYSPQPGCWAIAFGEAEARAVATAVVDAIAEGIAQAVGSDVAAYALASAESQSRSVAEAVASVAILLASGDGSGFKTARGTATAEAKAIAVNCALAYAYSAVFEGSEADAAAIAAAGCPAPEAASAFATSRAISPDCTCNGEGSGTPAGCGRWGGQDNICYVSSSCTCGEQSQTYPGQRWRYCGDTLSTMQSYLGKYDDSNDIYPFQGGNGYCPSQS